MTATPTPEYTWIANYRSAGWERPARHGDAYLGIDPTDQADASPALAFLLQTVASIPAACPLRPRRALLNDALAHAIDTGMKFAPDEGPTLDRLTERSSAACFYPLTTELYTRACLAGSPYAALWETHRGIKPWRADGSAKPVHHHEKAPGSTWRVAPDMPLLLPWPDPAHRRSDGPAPEAGAHRWHNGLWVWWCADVRPEHILLRRYTAPAFGLVRQGQPKKSLLLTRQEWKTLWPPTKPAATQETTP